MKAYQEVPNRLRLRTRNISLFEKAMQATMFSRGMSAQFCASIQDSGQVHIRTIKRYGRPSNMQHIKIPDCVIQTPDYPSRRPG